MLTTLAFVAALGLVPSQAANLNLTNMRPTYGVLGAQRPDTKFLPGDTFFLAYDIENLKMNEKGEVFYGMTMEVADAKGKIWYKEEKAQENNRAVIALGGNKVPAFANADLGLDMPKGDYVLKVTVTDRSTKASKELTSKFEVLEKGFGLVRLTTSYDVDGRLPAPMIGVPGQGLHLQWVAVGFGRDSGKKQPNLTVETKVFDEEGKPTLPKAFPGEVTDVQEKLAYVEMGLGISLNRPGKFTVEIKVTDNVAKKTAILKFPLVVLANDLKAR